MKRAGEQERALAEDRQPDFSAFPRPSKLSRHDTDTGSPEAQIEILTLRIQHITQHLQLHRQGHHSRRGLLQLVGRRRRLLKYLSRVDVESYRTVLQELDLRR
jgi:small subunit ribosomal protein S15